MAHESQEIPLCYEDYLMGVEKGEKPSMNRNIRNQSSKSNQLLVRSRTPDLKEMRNASNGIIEKSKTTGNLQLDQYNIDATSHGPKDRNAKHKIGKNSSNNSFTNPKEDLCGSVTRKRESNILVVEPIFGSKHDSMGMRSNISSAFHLTNQEHESIQTKVKKNPEPTGASKNAKSFDKRRRFVQDKISSIITGKQRLSGVSAAIKTSQSQSPPSPKKLASTNSETAISPRNEPSNCNLADAAQSNALHTAENGSELKYNLDANAIQFELGPPNESFVGALEVDVKGSNVNSTDIPFSFTNRPDNSGPASLDLTKDIASSGLRPNTKFQSLDDNGFRHNQTASEISATLVKNEKNSSSNSSSNSSGYLANINTASSSLNSIGSQTSTSNDSGAQVSSQTGSNGRPAKKKSWYNALYPTYKSRADDFKKIFSALPQEEKLIVEYSCALQRDILVHGRLYVTKNYLCFYANIFRWETSVALRWKDVVAITKEKTALVIPNAIQISTENDERHFFTSFAARDRTYMMLFKLWQNALLDQPASSSEIWRWVHSVYGDELGLTSEDDPEYVNPSRIALSSLNDNTPPLSMYSSSTSRIFYPKTRDEEIIGDKSTNGNDNGHRNYVYDFILTDNQNNGINDAEDELNHEKFQKISNSNEANFNNLISDTYRDEKANQAKTEKRNRSNISRDQYETDNFSDYDSLDNANQSDGKGSQKGACERKRKDVNGQFKRKHSKITTLSNAVTNSNCELSNSGIEIAVDSWKTNQEGREIVSQVFPVPVDDLFSLLFGNSKFYNEFQESRKTFDMVQNDWQRIEKDSIHYTKTREVSFTLSLTHPMGPKHSRVTETQQMKCESEPGQMYFIDVDTVNSGIPYADSFYVELSYCLSKCTTDGNLVKINSRTAPHMQYSHFYVFAAIKYKKTVWGLVKTFIEKNTWAGLEEFFQNLAQALQIECEESLKPKVGLSRHIEINRERKSKKYSNDKESFGAITDEAEENSDENTQRSLMRSEKSESCQISPKALPSVRRPYRLRSISPQKSQKSTHQQKSYIENLSTWFFSWFSSLTVSDILVRIILLLLTGLLLSNSVLFYKLWVLEERLIKTPDKTGFFGHLHVDQTKLYGTEQGFGHSENEKSEAVSPEEPIISNSIHSVKSAADWLKLLHRQEVAHQLELEKWHAILGAATDLLRQTEQSLTNLQRNIHPLAIQNLRNLLDFQGEDWIHLIKDLEHQAGNQIQEPKNNGENQETGKYSHLKPSLKVLNQKDNETPHKEL